MFQQKYKRAYEKISPGKDLVFTEAEIEKYMEGQEKERKSNRISAWRTFRPIAVASLVVCLVAGLGLPVAAQNNPRVYDVLKKYVPTLLDYMVPIQKSDSSQGITLQVEAVHIEGNTANVIVSFSDVGIEDYIHGKVDMYDSYHLKSYSAESNVGGCSFLGYDPVENKAYFQAELTSTTGTFDTSRMEFYVGTLLTDCKSEVKEIALDTMPRQYEVKTVSVNGSGGSGKENPALDKLSQPGNAMDPRPVYRVLDIPMDKYSPDSMTIGGKAYMDGVLRIQICRGNLKEADRHMNLYMQTESGEELYPDLTVSWQEEVAGENVSLEEYYFVLSEEQLNTYTLWGEADIRSGCIHGDWSITFDLK